MNKTEKLPRFPLKRIKGKYAYEDLIFNFHERQKKIIEATSQHLFILYFQKIRLFTNFPLPARFIFPFKTWMQKIEWHLNIIANFIQIFDVKII